MTPLQRLFGRDDKFYRLLESSAAEAQLGAGLLSRLLTELAQSSSDNAQREIDQSRRKHKRIGQEITSEIFKTFVTPLDREDIEAVSSALYKISKSIEKIAERLLIRPPTVTLDPIKRQTALLEEGAKIVAKMVGDLQKKNHAETIGDDYERIQAIEGEADRIMTDLLKELYGSSLEARSLLYWKDLYELLEKAIDRCRDVGGLLFTIVLKNA